VTGEVREPAALAGLLLNASQERVEALEVIAHRQREQLIASR
jgi:hypothetical protein